MERALDPALLRQALGQHESLPSPGELAELLASAELALLLHRPAIPDKLVMTGWYLHAVASSQYALRTYGIERQRAAFRVAGHVFDLRLQSLELSRVDRLKYCFAAQIAYIRSELNPNALAIYHREFASDLGELSLRTHFREVALSCGVALLGLDVGYVFPTTRRLRHEIQRLAREWNVPDILATLFGSVAGVALGTQSIMTFLLYGESQALARAREVLRIAVLADCSGGDHISRWVAAHLLNLADDLEKASIWTALPPGVAPSVRKAFALGEPRILTLWPPQMDLLAAQTQDSNPLSSEAKRLFLSTPTSGGKTLLAQLMVVCHLAMEQTSVCYVAPTRSLCHEIRKALESRLRFVGTRIADGLPEGDWLDDPLDSEPRVEVMTPERLSYLVRSDSSRVLERFGMFVFDEVHTVGDPNRGWKLEEDLTYLHRATQGTHHRIVLMSAAVGNQFHFISWMEQGQNKVIHLDSDSRGPRRLHAIWTTDPDWNKPRKEPIRSRRFLHRLHYDVYGKLVARISHTGQTHSMRTVQPIGDLVLKIGPSGERIMDRAKSTAFYRMLVPIIHHLSKTGPVLVIESTRRQTILMAKAIADVQEPIDQTELQYLVDLVETRLATQHPLREVLSKGVAYHHGSLPSEIRTAIQEAVCNGDLTFLVATTTMTEGVNLPVGSVVIASQGSYGAEGPIEYITGSKLINAIGRAGRATKETEGVVVLARHARVTPSDFERLSPADSAIAIASMLTTEQALEDLAAFEELRRTAEDAVLEVSKGVVCDFIAFVWFVAAELEKLRKLATQEDMQDMLSYTLAWVQLDNANQARWLSVAGTVVARYRQTEAHSRRRWAQAGTSIGSARELENLAQELALALRNLTVPQDPIEAVDLIIGEGRLERILALREAPKMRVYTRRARGREEVTVAANVVLRDWLQGAELVTLAKDHFSDVADISFRFEQLGDFVNRYFEIFFPWAFGTIVAWANNLLQENGAQSLLPTTIPVNVRWGVGNPTATKLMAGGIQSRSLALRIARASEAAERDDDVRSWIRSMSVVDWQRVLEASVAELRNLLEFSRDPRGGIAVELLTRETATLEIESQTASFPQSSASLKQVADSELSPIGVWAGNQLVGQVFSRDQADVKSLLGSGLILSVQFSASSGKGLLELRLVHPGT